jgi:hypothetical protein
VSAPKTAARPLVVSEPVSRERCPNGWRCKIGCACHRLTEAELAVDLSEHFDVATYYDGARHALKRFAWWREGIEYVGSTGYTLERALADVDGAEAEGRSYSL